MDSLHPFISDELLSAYIDGEISEAERTQIEGALAADASVLWRLQTLTQTVRLLNDLPGVAAPRSFALRADEVAEVIARRQQAARAASAETAGWGTRLWQSLCGTWQSGSPLWRNAAAASLALFLVLVIADSPGLPSFNSTFGGAADSAMPAAASVEEIANVADSDTAASAPVSKQGDTAGAAQGAPAAQSENIQSQDAQSQDAQSAEVTAEPMLAAPIGTSNADTEIAETTTEEAVSDSEVADAAMAAVAAADSTAADSTAADSTAADSAANDGSATELASPALLAAERAALSALAEVSNADIAADTDSNGGEVVAAAADAGPSSLAPGPPTAAQSEPLYSTFAAPARDEPASKSANIETGTETETEAMTDTEIVTGIVTETVVNSVTEVDSVTDANLTAEVATSPLPSVSVVTDVDTITSSTSEREATAAVGVAGAGAASTPAPFSERSVDMDTYAARYLLNLQTAQLAAGLLALALGLLWLRSRKS